MENFTPEQESALVDAMEKFGGSFAKAIARAWSVADLDNRRKLRAAFGDLLALYKQFLDR